MRAWGRALGAAAVLLAVYVGLAFWNSPRGFLGTDTGGKVATLQVMTERGSFDPDLGYWAERWDPDGALYPLANTTHTSSGRWVNVTTLPALWVGWQLFRVGGYRAALLVPMAGSIAAAFAARASSARLGGGRRASWVAFWLVGLASPLTIYALDFWEHSVGVALMAWGVVVLLAVRERRWWLSAGGAGLLFGAAATMRTEALVYLVVAGLVVVGWLVVSRAGVVRSAAVGALLLVGAAVPLVANEAFERQVVGSTIRGARVAGTASAVGTAPESRVEEAAITTLALDGSARGIALGAAFAALLAFAAFRSRPAGFAFTKPDAGLALVAIGGAAALLVVRIVGAGLGFVPGMLAAWPPAAFALLVLTAESRRQRRDSAVKTVVAVAVVAVPVVLATQFRGGAAPQWGGRYLLVSGFLLTVAALAVGLGRKVIVAIAGLAAAVTAFGLVWVHQRTHDVDRAIAALNARPEPVVVSGVYHLAREGGATYSPTGKRWLTMTPTAGRDEVAAVLHEAGIDRFAAVELADTRRRDYPGFAPENTVALRLFDGVDLEVTAWRSTS